MTWRPVSEIGREHGPVWAWGPELKSLGMPTEGPVLATHTHWPARPATTGHRDWPSLARPAYDDWNSATEWDQDGTPEELDGVTHWMPLEIPEPPA